MKKILCLLVVFPFLSNAQTISTIIGTGLPGYSGDAGQATAASIYSPSGLAVDPSGNIYLSDYDNHTIRKVTPSGIITTIAGNGVAGSGGDGGPATGAQFSSPVKIFLDTSGNLFIADKMNNKVRKISSTGIITTFAGTGMLGFAGDGGAATAARLNHPTGVTGDTLGNIYIGDDGNFVVRKVSPAGVITTFAGTGTFASTGDGGPATAANLKGAYGVNLDANGNVYITDPPANKIRMVSPSGTITTFAGNGTSAFTGDGGAATAASLSNVAGIVFDNSGNAFVDDMFNGRVRKVSPTGIITTVVGSGVTGYAGDGGPAIAAQLHWSTELAFDVAGRLLITDNNNHRIRRVSGLPTTVSQLRTDMVFVNPNPAHDHITITLPYEGKPGKIQLINAVGQMVSEQIINNNSVDLNLSNLPSGIYIVSAQFDGEIVYKRIFKD